VIVGPGSPTIVVFPWMTVVESGDSKSSSEAFEETVMVLVKLVIVLPVEDDVSDDVDVVDHVVVLELDTVDEDKVEVCVLLFVKDRA
jgi:hypothetical protein